MSDFNKNTFELDRQEIDTLSELEVECKEAGIASISLPTPAFDDGPGDLYVEDSLEVEDSDELLAPLDSIPVLSPEPQAKEAQYVNIGFANAKTARPLEAQEGFLGQSLYRLTVSIDLTQDARYAARGGQPSLSRPTDGALDLDVVAVIEPQENLPLWFTSESCALLQWPTRGPSTRNAVFLLETGQVAKRLSALLSIQIYYQGNLIFAADIILTLQPANHVWATQERPIQWRNADAGDE